MNNKNGIAEWTITESAFACFSTVEFNGNSIELEDRDEDYDDDGNFLGWNRIFDAASQLGADPTQIWSVEDERYINKDEVI